MPNRTYLWSEGRGNRFLDVTQEHRTKQQHKLLASVKTAFLHVPHTNPLPPNPQERNSNRAGHPPRPGTRFSMYMYICIYILIYVCIKSVYYGLEA